MNDYKSKSIQRFNNKVKEAENGCHEWQGARSQFGHGKFHYNQKIVFAHRFMIEVIQGIEIPEGLFVMHKCDNPRCVNPEHLEIGTPKDNTQDMYQKGRAKPSGHRLKGRESSDKIVVYSIKKAREMGIIKW